MTSIVDRDFETIYRQHSDRVYRFCMSQLRDTSAAEDVAAEVFERAWRAFPGTRFGTELELRAWLYRIARNATVDHHRRQRATRSLLRRLYRSDASENIESVVALRQELQAVLAGMRTLSSKEMQMVGLRIAAGLSFVEIAQVMHMRESAVKMATHRALQKLRGLSWREESD